MPHRSPLVAALERCGQLRARIVEADPTRTVTIARVRDLDDALREVARLEQMLYGFESGQPTPIELEDDVAVLEGGSRSSSPDLPVRPLHVYAGLAGMAAVVMTVGLVVLARLPSGPPAGADAAPPSLGETNAIVTAASGGADVVVGERCAIVITLATDHDDHCDVAVRCARVAESFHVDECPRAPLHFVANGYGMDIVKKTATFETWHDGQRGAVDLALE